MKYNHIIWDWNGTLLDDAWLCVDMMNLILRKRNMKEITIEEYQNAFEFPVENYYKKLGFDFRKETFEILGTEFIINYNKNSHRCKLQHKAKYILGKISKLNKSQSILSAMQQNNLLDLVINHELKECFTDIIGLDNHYAKSKVERGKQWIKRSEYNTREILFIGDTIHDHEVAEKMGVDCILIPSGHYSKERLKYCNVPLLKSLHEVLNFI